MDLTKVLIVDDSTTITSILAQRLKQFNFELAIAHTFSEAVEIVENGGDFFIALLDLNLPDAANGEVVDFMLSRGVPSVVMTGNYHENQRHHFSQKAIIDYVLKDSPWSLEYIVNLAKRIYSNQQRTILIVDDSAVIRNCYKRLLETHNYTVIEAENGKAALRKLKRANGEIKLILTDYNMPIMNGFELISKVRAIYSKEDVSIIGLSAESDRTVSAKFLKLGANDFLSKGFIKEEFYARVIQNIDSIDLITRLKNIAMKDHLTGLFNRHYFFTAANKLISDAKKHSLKVYFAMVDIDFFKTVNDTYGHQIGDDVLVDFAQRFEANISQALNQSIVARFGGEEFVVITVDHEDSYSFIAALENLRIDVEQNPVICEDIKVTYTISIGTSFSNETKDLEEMVKCADDSLYIAKENGRNRIVVN